MSKKSVNSKSKASKVTPVELRERKLKHINKAIDKAIEKGDKNGINKLLSKEAEIEKSILIEE